MAGSPLRVALAIGTTGFGGGAEKQIALLAEGLVRLRGWEVRLFSNNSEAEDWGWWAAGRGVDFRPFRGRNRLTRVLDMIGELREYRPDVAHGYMATGGGYLCPLGRILGTPVVLYGERNVDVSRERRMNTAVLWAVTWIADAVICNTKVAAERMPGLLHLPASRFHYIPNGFQPSPPPDSAEINRVRAEIDPTGNAACVLMVGNCTPRKDYRSFLTIAAEVTKVEPRARFLAVGTGPDLPTLKNEVQERGLASHVVFLGERRDVPAILRSVQVFLHTGYLEGMSNAVMEAQEAGLPVVAVDAGGHPDLMTSSSRGFLFPRGRTDIAAAHVLKLLRQPAIRARVGIEAQQRIREELSVDALVERHALLYEQFLSARGGRSSHTDSS